jgi:hypothetical protein
LVTEGVSPIFDFPPQRIKNNNYQKIKDLKQAFHSVK